MRATLSLSATSSTPDSSGDSVPAALRAVLDLFAGELRGVGFPGIDASTLAQRADEVRARAREVERAQAALDAALGALAERTEALAALAGRALAYARIYAADDAALAARLDGIDLGERLPSATPPDGGARPALRRRRRAPDRPELPLGEVAPADE